MKSIFKKIAFVLALAMVVTSFPAQTAAAASGPQLKAHRVLYLNEGGDVTGTYLNKAYATVWGHKEDGYTVRFESENPEIATVGEKKGMVTAVSVGTTTVTATFSKKGVRDVVKTCKVEVKKNAAAVTVDANSEKKVAELSVGEKFTATAVKTDADGSTENVTDGVRFAVADDKIATVNTKTGEITAVAAGETTLTVWGVQWEYSMTEKKYVLTKTTPETPYKLVVTSAFAVKATGLKELTVTGNFAGDAAFTIKKGTQNINAEAVIAADGKSAVLALTSRLTKGIYTVSCGNESASVEVEDEKVVAIDIKEDGKLISTNAARDVAYVHYDVLNQYGESVRKSYTVTWSPSAGRIDKEDKENGILHIKLADGNTFMYGSTLFLTAVHTSAGNVVPKNASMTIGLENCVNEVKVFGVVKESNPSQILTKLPAGFLSGEYLLVFKMLDRYGYEMSYDEAQARNLSFASFSPLLVTFGENGLVEEGVYIDGVQYGAFKLERGVQVKSGGTATLQITSTKTGQPTKYALEVESEQVLSEFRITPPDSVVAKNDGTVYLSYEAIDTEGGQITNFRTLYNSVTFSSPNFYFVENNDGSASLRYDIEGSLNPTKDYDATVMHTAIVTASGKATNVNFNVKANRYAAGIEKYDGSRNILEGDTLEIVYGTPGGGQNGFFYYDQYDESIPGWKYGSADWQICVPTGIKLAVKVIGDHLTVTGTPAVVSEADEAYQYFALNSVFLTADEESTEGITSRVVEFALSDENGKIISGSSRRVIFNIVDLNQCTGFSIGGSSLQENGVDTGYYNVTGTLANGTTVAIPDTISGSAIVAYSVESVPAGTVDALGLNGFRPNLSTEDNAFKDLSVTNANGTHPDRNQSYNVVATIYFPGTVTVKDKVSMKVEVGAYTRKKASFGFDGGKSWIEYGKSAYVNATAGVISYTDLVGYINDVADNYGSHTWSTPAGVEITVTKLVEGSKGLRANSLRLSKNVVTSPETMIVGAEIGDTFVVTYKLENANATISFTVGADNTATTRDSKTCEWR